jgi:hypothetical protein
VLCNFTFVFIATNRAKDKRKRKNQPKRIELIALNGFPRKFRKKKN